MSHKNTQYFKRKEDSVFSGFLGIHSFFRHESKMKAVMNLEKEGERRNRKCDHGNRLERIVHMQGAHTGPKKIL